MLLILKLPFKVDFEVTIVTSFKGVTLEVGGDLETYWKSTTISGDRLTHLPPPRTLRRPNHTGSVVSSPVYAASKGGGQTLMISSLQGNYLYVVIQVTRDFHPVVYFDWLLPGIEFELGVADVSLAQFEMLAEKLGRNEIVAGNTVGDWARSVSRLMIPLEKLLKVFHIFHRPYFSESKAKLTYFCSQLLPLDIDTAFDLAYPSQATRVSLSIGRLDLNNFVDSVLQTIFNVSDLLETPDTRRKVTFISFSSDVCSALNWKQPNCMSCVVLCGLSVIHVLQILCSLDASVEKMVFTFRVLLLFGVQAAILEESPVSGLQLSLLKQIICSEYLLMLIYWCDHIGVYVRIDRELTVWFRFKYHH